MISFNPVEATIGGILLAIASSLLLLLTGRLAAISGIVDRVIGRPRSDGLWRYAFIAGVLIGGVLLLVFSPQSIGASQDRSLPALAVAGLCVGLGSRMANGCTSGHGVCGIPRGSIRSIAAVMIFMAVGALTVFVVRQFLGGRV